MLNMTDSQEIQIKTSLNETQTDTTSKVNAEGSLPTNQSQWGITTHPLESLKGKRLTT